jgi:hypothetical protein
MKNLIFNMVGIMAMLMFITSCVDDYKDANPPRLLDAPAVNSISISDTVAVRGETVIITVNVVDAPAGLASVTLTDVDQFGVDAGGTSNVTSDFQGLTKGEVTIEYTTPETFDGVITLSVFVSDGQVDKDGEDASKSSAPREIELLVYCPLNDDFEGTYQLTPVTGSAVTGTTLFGTGEVTIVSTGPSTRAIEGGVKYAPELGFANDSIDFEFNLSCNDRATILEQIASNLFCDQSIQFGPDPDGGALFDRTDDTYFEVSFIEDVTNDCGDGSFLVTIGFTKVEYK